MNTRPGLVLMLQEERRAHAVTSDHLAAKSRLVIDQAARIRELERKLVRFCETTGHASPRSDPRRMHYTVIVDKNHLDSCRDPAGYLKSLVEEIREGLAREMRRPSP